MAQLKNTTINDTGFLQVPTGTTAQRPASPDDGYVRFNTSTSRLEYYRDGEWHDLDDRIEASASNAEKTYDIVENGVPYTVHVFTNEQGAGSLNVTQSGEVEYLIVAGGGGGGGTGAGGAGAGGFLTGKTVISPGTYPISVGAGGSAGRTYNNSPQSGSQGGNSSAFGLTAIGGGPTRGGQNGGSGGGADRSGSPGQGVAGQGNRGGFAPFANGQATAGGGGAGSVGQDAPNANLGGAGGIGRPSAITGETVWYAGGGGGGRYGGTPGNGGKGGGGSGGIVTSASGDNGAKNGFPNTGGGGGGGGYNGALPSAQGGGNGGSGIVVVRYKKDYLSTNALQGAQIDLSTGFGGSKEGLVFAFEPTDHKSLYDELWQNRVIKDTSGNNNNGAYSNGFLTKDGRDNGALFFDGNHITITYNAATMDFSRGQTILIWLRPQTRVNRCNIYDQAYGGSGTITNETSGVFNYYHGTNGGNGSPYQGFTSGFTVPAGETALITATRNNIANRIRWYKNGVLSNEATSSYDVTTNSTANIRMGLGYAGQYTGHLYFTAVYTRELSDLEIKQIYDATKWRFGF